MKTTQILRRDKFLVKIPFLISSLFKLLLYVIKWYVLLETYMNRKINKRRFQPYNFQKTWIFFRKVMTPFLKLQPSLLSFKKQNETHKKILHASRYITVTQLDSTLLIGNIHLRDSKKFSDKNRFSWNQSDVSDMTITRCRLYILWSFLYHQVRINLTHNPH